MVQGFGRALAEDTGWRAMEGGTMGHTADQKVLGEGQIVALCRAGPECERASGSLEDSGLRLQQI